PILVDTGTQAEIMSFGAATLTSAGHYNLSYLRRGLYGSIDQAHVSTDLFVRLDGAIFQIAMDPGYAGQTVYFKFVSFNTWQQYGPQTLSGATAYSYTIPNANSISGVSTLIPRFSCAVSADGTTVYKSTQSSGAWDSDAYSPQGYLNGCFISWRVSSTAYFSLVGLSNNPTSTVSYTKLNFGLEIDSGGNLDIYELGTHIGTFGTYAAGDAFEIRYDGVTARYFHNGALMRAVRAPGLTLYPAICQYSPGAVISNVEFGPSSAVNQPSGSWLNNYPWVIGATGIQGNYADIGGYSASAIYMAGNGGTPLGPYGMSEPLWIAYGGINGANGGWNDNGDLYGIDSSKTYRSTVWVYWNGQG